MQSFYFWFFLAIRSVFILGGTADRLEQIVELSARSINNVITLDDETYTHYAMNKPNPYSLIVFMTAAHPKFKCSVCKAHDTEFQLLASSYKRAMKAEGRKEDVFFVRLDYESSQNVFQRYETNSVPVLFHLGGAGSEGAAHSAAAVAASTSGKGYHILHRDKFQMNSDVSAESMATFVRARCGANIPIERSRISVYITILVLFGIVSTLVKPIINSLEGVLLPMLRYKPLWTFLSLGVYTCAISGLIFDIIRSPQFYYADPRSGQYMFFYPQSGSQFVIEGFIIGGLNLCCAAALIFLTIKAPVIKSEQARLIAIVAGMAVFLLCFNQVKGLYRMKNRWYGSSM